MPKYAVNYVVEVSREAVVIADDVDHAREIVVDGDVFEGEALVSETEEFLSPIEILTVDELDSEESVNEDYDSEDACCGGGCHMDDSEEILGEENTQENCAETSCNSAR